MYRSLIPGRVPSLVDKYPQTTQTRYKIAPRTPAVGGLASLLGHPLRDHDPPSEKHLLTEESCAIVEAGRHLLGEFRVLRFDGRKLVGVSASSERAARTNCGCRESVCGDIKG